ncbi:hypothetical protein BH23BAC3_BH23BAC3_14380 [soil metagenome]
MMCFCLLGGVIASAQGLENLKKDREKVKDSDRRTIELFKKLTFGTHHQINRFKTANENLLERVEIQSWQEPDFVPFYRNDYGYQNGRRVQATTYFSNFVLPPEWMPASRELFSYDNGQIAATIEQDHDGDDFVNDRRSVYSYQQVGGVPVIDTEIDQEWDSSAEEWVNYQRARFIAENNEIVRLEESNWDGEDWELENRTLISHVNNDLYFTYQERIGEDEWENDFRDIYHDLTFMELYEVFIEAFVDQVFFGSTMIFLTNFPDWTEQVWDGDDWVNEFRLVSTVTTDQGTGQVTGRTVTEEFFEGDDWIAESQIQIEYDGGQPVVYTMYEPGFVGDSEEMVAVMREDHSFNEEDLLAQILQYALFLDDDDEMEEELSSRTVMSYSGISTSIEPGTRPETFSLGNAYPNPFNPVTVVPFQAGSAGHVSIRVYDMLGRYVATLADEIYPAGNHNVQFDASGLSSGVYMLRMQAPGLQQVRRVTLVK